MTARQAVEARLITQLRQPSPPQGSQHQQAIGETLSDVGLLQRRIQGGIGGLNPPPRGFLACPFEGSYGPAFLRTLPRVPPPPSRIPGSAPVLILAHVGYLCKSLTKYEYPIAMCI